MPYFLWNRQFSSKNTQGTVTAHITWAAYPCVYSGVWRYLQECKDGSPLSIYNFSKKISPIGCLRRTLVKSPYGTAGTYSNHYDCGSDIHCYCRIWHSKETQSKGMAMVHKLSSYRLFRTNRHRMFQTIRLWWETWLLRRWNSWMGYAPYFSSMVRIDFLVRMERSKILPWQYDVERYDAIYALSYGKKYWCILLWIDDGCHSHNNPNVLCR